MTNQEHSDQIQISKQRVRSSQDIEPQTRHLGRITDIADNAASSRSGGTYEHRKVIAEKASEKSVRAETLPERLSMLPPPATRRYDSGTALEAFAESLLLLQNERVRNSQKGAFNDDTNRWNVEGENWANSLPLTNCCIWLS